MLLHKKCRNCKQFFVARSKRSKFCSPTCQHADWVKKNRAYINRYQKEWRERDLDAYNMRRRKPWPFVSCKKCGTVFQKHSGSQIFCGSKCREKNQRQKPKTKIKQRLRQKKWRKNNQERNRAYHRAYYHGTLREKIKTQPWKPLLESAKRRAVKNNVAFTLTAMWAKRTWTGKCILTGIAFSGPRKRRGYKNRNLSPSIDRKKVKGGYTPKNCRFVLWAVNSFKRDGTDATMYRIAEALVNNKKRS